LKIYSLILNWWSTYTYAYNSIVKIYSPRDVIMSPATSFSYDLISITTDYSSGENLMKLRIFHEYLPHYSIVRRVKSHPKIVDLWLASF
jgi:hypothetical protein